MTPHVYRIYIRAGRDEVWRAVTDPEFTRRYFHATAFTSSLEPGSRFRYVLPDGSDAVIGEIEVADAPARLVMSWRILYDADAADEPPSRVEWTFTDVGDGMTRVDVIHGDLGQSPLTWASVRDGWTWILDSLKSLLETGASLPPDTTSATRPDRDATLGTWHRQQAIEANNSIWPLLERTDRTPDDDEQLLRRAYTAAYHWERAADRGPEHEVRATYMIAKALLAVGEVGAARRSAERCLRSCEAAGLADFDLAYAHEVTARVLDAGGASDLAAAHWRAARAVAIADPEDRALVEADLADGPSDYSPA